MRWAFIAWVGLEAWGYPGVRNLRLYSHHLTRPAASAQILYQLIFLCKQKVDATIFDFIRQKSSYALINFTTH